LLLVSFSDKVSCFRLGQTHAFSLVCDTTQCLFLGRWSTTWATPQAHELISDCMD
jgi:hypothetical protein